MDMERLFQLLISYQAVDLQEQKYLKQMRDLSKVGMESCFRNHFQPGHFTASSFVLSEDRTELALIFHPKFQRWLQPGGHIEPEDGDILTAAMREIEEELGITALSVVGEGLFDVDIHEIPARKNEPAHKHFDLRFCFISAERTFTGELEASWVPLTRVSAIESDASVMRAVKKLLS
jgi:ADP-ribose pyrophosphatase YjhB (NUDIX family)